MGFRDFGGSDRFLCFSYCSYCDYLSFDRALASSDGPWLVERTSLIAWRWFAFFTSLFRVYLSLADFTKFWGSPITNPSLIFFQTPWEDMLFDFLGLLSLIRRYSSPQATFRQISPSFNARLYNIICPLATIYETWTLTASRAPQCTAHSCRLSVLQTSLKRTYQRSTAFSFEPPYFGSFKVSNEELTITARETKGVKIEWTWR